MKSAESSVDSIDASMEAAPACALAAPSPYHCYWSLVVSTSMSEDSNGARADELRIVRRKGLLSYPGTQLLSNRCACP